MDICSKCGSIMIDINGNCPVCDGVIEHENIIAVRNELIEFIYRKLFMTKGIKND